MRLNLVHPKHGDGADLVSHRHWLNPYLSFVDPTLLRKCISQIFTAQLFREWTHTAALRLFSRISVYLLIHWNGVCWDVGLGKSVLLFPSLTSFFCFWQEADLVMQEDKGCYLQHTSGRCLLEPRMGQKLKLRLKQPLNHALSLCALSIHNRKTEPPTIYCEPQNICLCQPQSNHRY